MLNVSDAMTAEAVCQYFQGSRESYYIDGINPPGIWGGELMKEWGLHGKTVEKEQFERLAHGYDPITGEDLTQERRENRRACNDITMSAPKDFGLIYLAEKDEKKRQRLLQIFVESCDWIMGLMEPDAATRVRSNGADHDRITSNWGYAGFLQFDSRPAKTPGSQKSEPVVPTIDIHRHHTVFNFSRDPVERRLKALQIGLVKENADLWMPIWHNELARRVRRNWAMASGARRKPASSASPLPACRVRWCVRNSPRRRRSLEAKERIAQETQEGITRPRTAPALQAELAG